MNKPHHISWHGYLKLMKKSCCLFIFYLIFITYSSSQNIDILIKNGLLIDPANNIHAIKDIAVHEGKILKVGTDFTLFKAKKTIDAKGLIVCPGFIDLHTHVFVGSKPDVFADGIYSLSPDDITLKAGVTTVVDAGTSGWRNFPQFKQQVIDQSKTRILAWLNISGNGMSAKDSETDINDIDPDNAYATRQKYKDIIVGIKIGHYPGKDWTPFDHALTACNKSDIPLFVECHLPNYTLEEQLDHMRPGDIITHTYENITERMPVIDSNGMLQPFIKSAIQKGILFDVGHGGAGFWFNQAIPALRQGLSPNSFGTDLHRFSMNAGMKDMLNVMSKYLAMGMSIEDIILKATWAPAQAIKRKDLGTLAEGSVADIAIIRIRKGNYGFIDASGARIKGKKKLEAEMTIRDGKIVWDLNGLAATPYVK